MIIPKAAPKYGFPPNFLVALNPINTGKKVEEKGNLLQRAVQLLSDIFVPIIPAIVAGGLLMGINNILTAQGLFFAKKVPFTTSISVNDSSSTLLSSTRFKRSLVAQCIAPVMFSLPTTQLIISLAILL